MEEGESDASIFEPPQDIAKQGVTQLPMTCFAGLESLMAEGRGPDWAEYTTDDFRLTARAYWTHERLSYIRQHLRAAPQAPDLTKQTIHLLCASDDFRIAVKGASRMVDKVSQVENAGAEAKRLEEETRKYLIPACVAIIKAVFERAAVAEVELGSFTKVTLEVALRALDWTYKLEEMISNGEEWKGRLEEALKPLAGCALGAMQGLRDDEARDEEGEEGSRGRVESAEEGMDKGEARSGDDGLKGPESTGEASDETESVVNGVDADESDWEEDGGGESDGESSDTGESDGERSSHQDSNDWDKGAVERNGCDKGVEEESNDSGKGDEEEESNGIDEEESNGIEDKESDGWDKDIEEEESNSIEEEENDGLDKDIEEEESNSWANGVKEDGTTSWDKSIDEDETTNCGKLTEEESDDGDENMEERERNDKGETMEEAELTEEECLSEASTQSGYEPDLEPDSDFSRNGSRRRRIVRLRVRRSNEVENGDGATGLKSDSDFSKIWGKRRRAGRNKTTITVLSSSSSELECDSDRTRTGDRRRDTHHAFASAPDEVGNGDTAIHKTETHAGQKRPTEAAEFSSPPPPKRLCRGDTSPRIQSDSKVLFGPKAPLLRRLPPRQREMASPLSAKGRGTSSRTQSDPKVLFGPKAPLLKRLPSKQSVMDSPPSELPGPKATVLRALPKQRVMASSLSAKGPRRSTRVKELQKPNKELQKPNKDVGRLGIPNWVKPPLYTTLYNDIGNGMRVPASNRRGFLVRDGLGFFASKEERLR